MNYPISPARWASYGKPFYNAGSCPGIRCKSRDTVQGRLSFYSSTLTPEGYTGVLWCVQSPTGWSGDRYSQAYVVQPVASVVSLTGDTGPNGSYDVFWEVDMQAVTGIAYNDYYGLQISMNPGMSQETGPHYTADLVIHVQDSFK